MTDAPLIFDLDPVSLGDLVTRLDMPRFRADQVLHWLYRRHVNDPRMMANISTDDREKLASALRFSSGTMLRRQDASDGVQKLLLAWDSGENLQSECVMIPADDRRTACVSSQVGCPVGCRFCASGLGGLDANLTSGQIVEQVWRLDQLEGVDRITHVVFMGMGEPLANFEQVVRAVRTLTAEWGLHISARRITISTVGLPAQIRRLADVELPVTLAVSLHAPDDDIRRRLIPWARYVTMDQLLDAGRYYFEKTGREVTLEYTLLRGVNDRPEHAGALVKIARQLRGHVNLIRYNEVAGLPFERPRDADVLAFEAVLRDAGVNTHIRASRGRDISAACGQLRHENRVTSNQ